MNAVSVRKYILMESNITLRFATCIIKITVTMLLLKTVQKFSISYNI